MVKEIFGWGNSPDRLVEKKLAEQPLAKFYFNLRSSGLKDKNLILDKMDRYVHLMKDKKAVKTQAFEELETTLLLDIFHIINGRPYAEWDHLSSSVLALEEYKSLPDEKRALFRTGLTFVPHKKRAFSPVSKQNARV